MSQVLQGMAGMDSANYNARLAGQQGQLALQQGAAEAERVRNAARYAAGEAIAAQGESGLQVGTGSALDLLRESRINAELDMMTVRTKAENERRTLNNRRRLLRAEARDALTGGTIAAGETALKAGMAGGGG